MAINDLNNEIPFIATSLAGHDAGKTYVAIGVCGDRILLADGLTRPMRNPKKKNASHIQAQINTPAVKQLRGVINIQDSDIIFALKELGRNKCQNQT